MGMLVDNGWQAVYVLYGEYDDGDCRGAVKSQIPQITHGVLKMVGQAAMRPQLKTQNNGGKAMYLTVFNSHLEMLTWLKAQIFNVECMRIVLENGKFKLWWK